MSCVECTKNRSDQMKELFYENEENCKKAYQDGYNQALNDFIFSAVEEQKNIWCDDDYETGICVGYEYCIKIAREMKK